MTAQAIIESARTSYLKGTKLKDSTEENDAILLEYLNFAKNQLAQDALLWLGGEEIVMVEDSYEYTLSTIPIQILDVYNEANVLIYRNSPELMGYFQTSPNTIKINNIEDGKKIFINYYYTPSDYAINDEVNIPPALLNAIKYFIAHQTYDMYKSEKEIITSTNYYNRYVKSIEMFKNKTDIGSGNSIYIVDMIKDKGLV
jgi:hypothetical protein